MNSTHPPDPEQAFRAAVEAHDLSRAESALRQYVEWFRSRPRTLQEVGDARNLFAWGVQVTTAHKARVAEELILLTKVLNAYAPRKRSHTWRLQG